MKKEEFEKKLETDKVVLVKFFADWCGPCKALKPVVDEIAGELGECLEVLEVDVDDSGELASEYGIRGIPSMLFIKNGKVHSTLVGNQPKSAILENINKAKD